MIQVFRYDDFSAISSSVLERLLIDAISEAACPWTFSVVPFALDSDVFLATGDLHVRPISPEKVALVRDLVDSGLIEIALHGWTHIASSPLRHHAEFSDLMPLQTQRRLIGDGRRALEDAFGKAINLFVPPWNRLGATTLVALQEEGITVVSAGYPSHWDWESPLAAQSSDLFRSIPCWRRLSETEKSLRLTQRFAGNQTVVGTLIHDYDFHEGGFRPIPGEKPVTIADLKNILRIVRSAPGVEILTAGAAAMRIEAGSSRFAAHSRLNRQCSTGFFSRRLWDRYIAAAYWDQAALRRWKLLSAVVNPFHHA